MIDAAASAYVWLTEKRIKVQISFNGVQGEEHVLTQFSQSRESRASMVMESLTGKLVLRPWANRWLNGTTNLYVELNGRRTPSDNSLPPQEYDLLVSMTVYPWWRLWRKLHLTKVYRYEFLTKQEIAASVTLILKDFDVFFDRVHWWNKLWPTKNRK